jgi:hypothetical protein
MYIFSETSLRAIAVHALVIITCLLGASCAHKATLTVRKLDVVSPDRRWIASSDIAQNGWFGRPTITTTLYLRWAGDSHAPPAEVVRFSCPGRMSMQYVPDDTNRPISPIRLSLKWIDSSHLRVTYAQNLEVVPRAVDLNVTPIQVIEGKSSFDGAASLDVGCRIVWHENAFAPIVRARPGPTFGRPVHPRDGSLDYGPVLLLMPFGSHLTVDTLPSGDSASSPASEVISPAFGYDAPHLSVRGTSTLLNNALLSAHYRPVRLPLAFGRFPG